MSIQNPFTDNRQSIDTFTPLPNDGVILPIYPANSKSLIDEFMERFDKADFTNSLNGRPSQELNALLQRIVSGNEHMTRKSNTNEFLSDIDRILQEE